MTYLTEEQYLEKLKEDAICFRKYDTLSDEWKKRFLDFMTGKKTLPLTYDPIFKRVFDCDIHPERLSRLISSIIGVDVEVVAVLSNEGMLLDEESLLIMDIVVRLNDGSLANVEMQKIPYAFAGERMACYSSDLLLRQYSKVKAEKGKKFSYKDMRKVYTIVFFEKTGDEYNFIHFEGGYIHHGSTKFDTGIQVNLLQEYWLVALDEFRKTTYPKDNSEQTAWISLLATENAEDIDGLIREYPWLEEIYSEISEYMVKPGEVLNMFSEALRIMDKNTVKYMMEELEKKLNDKTAQLQDIEKQLADSEKRLADNEKQLADSEKQLADNEKRLADNEKQLADNEKQLEDNEKLIAEQCAEIERLKRQLAAQHAE